METVNIYTVSSSTKMCVLRDGTFSILAISTMLPIFQAIGALGWNRACVEIGAQWYLAERLSLLVGVCLFVGRMPERFWPGKFDIWAVRTSCSIRSPWRGMWGFRFSTLPVHYKRRYTWLNIYFLLYKNLVSNTNKVQGWNVRYVLYTTPRLYHVIWE